MSQMRLFPFSSLCLALALLLPALLSLVRSTPQEEDQSAPSSALSHQAALPFVLCQQFPGLEACQQQQPAVVAPMEKRKSAYMRFGKRKSAYMRFGKRAAFGNEEEDLQAEEPMEKRKSAYMRFGKRKSAYMRFGRK